ncbi:hypothetical protein GX917_02030 [Candidatus Falkowbacteria bacterium]|jgi:hypothetical protein|nr:hypothetical protein [Candidatus Falkowbacteria bacterium]
MKKYFLTIISTLLFALPAKAACPVCVVAVGAGLGLSEYLGIDDSIAGIWIGGLLIALTIWTINWFNKKGYSFGNKTIRNFLTAILYYTMVIWPLAANNFIGQPANTLFGLDKLVLGIVIGSLVFIGATLWYDNIKKKNNGHAWFPFQKVVWPVGALLIFSFIFYFLTS